MEISPRYPSTSSEKVWGEGISRERAKDTAFSAAALLPEPFKALVSTMGQPKAADNLPVSILSPFLWTMSIMFKAMTMGAPTSRSWVVRYRFRSRLEASTMFKMTSGLSFTR